MTKQNLEQIKSSNSIQSIHEYSSRKFSDTKEINLDKNLQNLQSKHESQIENIISKNRKLLAILAHDIRSPMGLVVGFLELLRNDIDNLEKVEIKAEIENALESAEKSFLLLDNLLKWATSDKNIKTFQQEYIDLASLIQDEIENIEPFANQKQIKVYAYDIPHIEIFVDKNKIKSVFRNILQNAIKHTFIKGEITISVVKQNKHVEISIMDNGIGIKEKIRKSLFVTQSVNYSNTIKNREKGFGLMFCKEIIDLHGGEIGVISEHGKGSEFKFTVPTEPI